MSSQQQLSQLVRTRQPTMPLSTIAPVKWWSSFALSHVIMPDKDLFCPFKKDFFYSSFSSSFVPDPSQQQMLDYLAEGQALEAISVSC